MNKYLEKMVTRGTSVGDDMADGTSPLEQFKEFMSKEFQKTVKL